MNLGKYKEILYFAGIVMVSLYVENIPILILSYVIGITLIIVSSIRRQNTSKKIPIIPYSDVLKRAKTDPKLKETIELLSSSKETNRLLGIRFIHEITKQDTTKYTQITFCILKTYIENFSKQGLTKEVQLIIDILFDKQNDIYRKIYKERGYSLKIENCDFSEITFAESKLEFVMFENCNYNKTNIEGSMEQSEFKKCTFTNINFTNSLQDVEFVNCTFTDVNFSESKLKLLFIYDSTLTNVNFSNMKNASSVEFDFDNCIMDNVQLNNNKEIQLSIFNCTVKNSDFSNSKYTNVILRNSNFTDTSFLKVLLEKIEFEKSTFCENSLLDFGSAKPKTADYIQQ